MKVKYFFIILVLCMEVVLMVKSGFASNIIEFGPQETEITGSIKYTVIGKYRSQFEQFRGEIKLNKERNEIESVYLEIEAGTIQSNCKWCDKIVRSEQLLDTEKYPKILFRSNEIIKTINGYSVKGVLDMHGVKKQVSFPFEYKITKSKMSKEHFLSVKGKWIIKRKDFNIVWNKFLDKGGVLVGNDITVDWGIKYIINVI